MIQTEKIRIRKNFIGAQLSPATRSPVPIWRWSKGRFRSIYIQDALRTG